MKAKQYRDVIGFMKMFKKSLVSSVKKIPIVRYKIYFENMATNVNNAERLRSYFLSHKQRENIINVCRARPNWDGCDYCDLYSGSGLPCWKQDDKHNCCKLEEVKTKKQGG